MVSGQREEVHDGAAGDGSPLPPFACRCRRLPVLTVIWSEMALSWAVRLTNFSWCFRMRTRSFAIILTLFICPAFACFLMSRINFFSSRSSEARSRSRPRTERSTWSREEGGRAT